MTTNVFLNRDGERIPGERLSLMSSAQEYARQFYDEDIQQVVDTAAECDGKLPSMVSQMRNEPPLFGKTFPEFSAEQLKKMKEQLGL